MASSMTPTPTLPSAESMQSHYREFIIKILKSKAPPQSGI